MRGADSGVEHGAEKLAVIVGHGWLSSGNAQGSPPP
jgi:hypothetical protein